MPEKCEFSLELVGRDAPPAPYVDGVRTRTALRRILLAGTLAPDIEVVFRRSIELAASGDVTVDLWNELDAYGVALNYDEFVMVRVSVPIDGQAPGAGPGDAVVTLRSGVTNPAGIFSADNVPTTFLKLGHSIMWFCEERDGVVTSWTGAASVRNLRLTEDNGEGPVVVDLEVWGRRA